MKFALTADHLDFYAKHGFIGFESLFDSTQIKTLQEAIRTQSPRRFDLWRGSPEIKKILFQSALAKIASELFRSPLVRLGFDQYIDAPTAPFVGLSTLQDLSCAHPLLGALIIRLSPADPTREKSLIPDPLGSGLYIQATKPIDWTTLFGEPQAEWLMIAYAPKTSLYRKEPSNPHTHLWKEMGYVFGDRLKDSTHPILYRG